jgi:hypothetical protein
VRPWSRGSKSMPKTFREWNVEQRWPLPPSVMDFVPADHVAHLVWDTVREQLDLWEIIAPYEGRGVGLPARPSGNDHGAAAVCVLPSTAKGCTRCGASPSV